MPLTPDEIAAIHASATCFIAGTFGPSPDEQTPTMVVAQRRGARFSNAYIKGVPCQLPHAPEDWAICDAVAIDLAHAMGCLTRAQYHEMLELLGNKILERLT